MKKAVTLLACAFALACSSGGNAKIIQPEIEFLQIVGPAETMYQRGNIEVQYGLRIANRSAEPITLRRVQVESVGAGGPYRLRRETYYFKREIAPSEFGDVSFWAKAVSTGGALAIDAQAPITVRGIAYFDSPAGNFRKIFIENIAQNASTRGPR